MWRKMFETTTTSLVLYGFVGQLLLEAPYLVPQLSTHVCVRSPQNPTMKGHPQENKNHLENHLELQTRSCLSLRIHTLPDSSRFDDQKIPSKNNRIVGLIPFLGHTWILTVCLFQLDDSKSLHKQMVGNHHLHPFKTGCTV